MKDTKSIKEKQEEALQTVSNDMWKYSRRFNLLKGTKQEKDNFAKVFKKTIYRKNLESDDIIHLDGIPQ